MYHVRMVRSQSVDLLFISWLFKQKLTLPLYGQYPNPFLIKKITGKKATVSLQNRYFGRGNNLSHTFPF